MISMTRQYVGYMEPEKDVYEVLLDMYEEGMDSATIDRIFDEMKEGLLPLLSKIAAAGRPDLSALEGHYDIDAQKKCRICCFPISALISTEALWQKASIPSLWAYATGISGPRTIILRMPRYPPFSAPSMREGMPFLSRISILFL